MFFFFLGAFRIAHHWENNRSTIEKNIKVPISDRSQQTKRAKQRSQHLPLSLLPHVDEPGPVSFIGRGLDKEDPNFAGDVFHLLQQKDYINMIKTTRTYLSSRLGMSIEIAHLMDITIATAIFRNPTWRYLPYVRPYVGEFPHKIWP